MSFPERQIVNHIQKKKKEKKLLRLIQHCHIYTLEQLPWKAAVTGEEQSRETKVCRNVSGEDADGYLESYSKWGK